MITIERTFDYELVRSFITNPRVYGQLTDDSCGPAETFEVCASELVIYELVKLDGNPAGVFMLVPENGYTMQVHTCLSPVMWGRAAEATKAGAEWLFSNTRVERINTQIPVFNKLAERLAQRSGMTQYGLCPKAFMKNGQLWDIALYGMSKGN